MVVHLQLDYLYALLYLVFSIILVTFNQSVFIKATIASTRHRWFSGRILIYQAEGPGTIPASTSVLFDIVEKMYVNDTCQKNLSYIGPDKKVLFL